MLRAVLEHSKFSTPLTVTIVSLSDDCIGRKAIEMNFWMDFFSFRYWKVTPIC